MLPGAPEKVSILLRNGAWQAEGDPEGRGWWAPLRFRTEAGAAAMVALMRRNRGYLPTRYRWTQEDRP